MVRDNLSFYEHEPVERTISIVGVPSELGSDERGLANAPQYLLKSGLEKMLTSLGGDVVETTMIPCRKPLHVVSAGSAKYLDEVVAAARLSSAVVEKAVRRKDFVLTLGGDHSIALGTVAGAASVHRSMGVIWIDAHPDANTHETTLTGNIHGMPAASLMGFGHPLLTDIGRTGRKISPENFLYIGLKDIDKAEIEFLRREKVSTVTMLDIAERGLLPARLAIDALRRKVDTIWVSMDMDSIDEGYAPGVGMPNSGGLTKREILSLAQYIGKTCILTGLDVVEISPAKDKDAKTATLALELTARFLGAEYSWYENYINEYKSTNVTKEERVVAPVRGRRGAF